MAQSQKSIAERFKTDREEPCTEQIALRIPPSLKAKLKKQDGWQEQTRQYLLKLVEGQDSDF